jgi:hypothetical protein
MEESGKLRKEGQKGTARDIEKEFSIVKLVQKCASHVTCEDGSKLISFLSRARVEN